MENADTVHCASCTFVTKRSATIRLFVPSHSEGALEQASLHQHKNQSAGEGEKTRVIIYQR